MNYIRKIRYIIKDEMMSGRKLGSISLNTNLYKKVKKEIIKLHGGPTTKRENFHIDGIYMINSKKIDKDYVLHYRNR